MPFEPLTIGAAMMTEDLPAHRDWLIERQRDLELQGFLSPRVLTGDWQAQVAAARAHLDGFTGRLGIHGPFIGFTIASRDPEVAAIVGRRMLRGLEICAGLGATQMVIHSPFTTWDANNLDAQEGQRDGVIAAVVETLGAAVARARDQGVTLVLENIEDRDPADRAALAEALGADVVKLSVDTGHANYAHRATGAPPVDYFVRLAGARLDHVHLQDTDGHADRHWAPGRGNIPWIAVFEALAALAHRPRLVLELRDRRDIPAGFAHLRDLGVAQ